VGKKTLSEWEKVKDNCPDMSLAETMGEYQWPLFEEKPSKKPKERDITSMHGQDWIENKS
jgi:hypothetical protein